MARAQGTPAVSFSNSSIECALTVVVRTLPRDVRATVNLVIASLSGISSTRTRFGIGSLDPYLVHCRHGLAAGAKRIRTFSPFEIDELPRRRSSCIATNWPVGRALLWVRMHDELQHDLSSADRGRTWRRKRWRRSLPATLRRGYWRDPPGIARPSGHFLSRPASDPGTASRLRPPVW